MTDYLREHRSRLPAVAFGRALARRWRELHPNEAQPTKRMILDNGVATDVKLYFEEDREMMDAVRSGLEADFPALARPRGPQSRSYPGLDAYAFKKARANQVG